MMGLTETAFSLEAISTGCMDFTADATRRCIMAGGKHGKKMKRWIMSRH